MDDNLINLLPEQEKSAFKNEEILEKISIIMLFVLISVVSLIFLLFFLRFFFFAQIESSQKQIFQKEKELKSDLFQNFQRAIEEKNQDISNIQSFQKKQILIIPIFEKISSLIAPGSIQLTNFSFQKVSKKIKMEKSSKSESSHTVGLSERRDESESAGADNIKIQTIGQIQLSGWAKSRQELFNFKKALEDEKNFKEVYFSPDSWVKPTDINFSLNFQTNEF